MKIDLGTHELDIINIIPTLGFIAGAIVSLFVGQPELAVGLFTAAGAQFIESPISKK